MKTLILILASISFCIVIGGATYEHLGVVPVWAAAPPASLTMFQGEYALAAERFWIPIHPVTLALLVLSLVLNWRTPRRWFIATTIVGYFTILVITTIYFVPELMAITRTAYSTTADPELTARAARWEMLSLARLGVLILLAIVAMFAISRSASGPATSEVRS